MARYDLIIRGGTLFDGSGSAPIEADVAVAQGRIAAVGAISTFGREEIDARGMIVTPGFVDIHTHYDCQAIWDSRLTPSSWHGVTTAVMGNCGVGFAPCRAEDHDRLIRLMEGVEDIPGAVLHEGLTWEWESFAEYLNALERLPHDIDFAAQVPHAALRVYVMGERGARREAATPHDIAAMAALATESIEAGALGFSTSRTLNHRTSDGDPTPTLTASSDELAGIAMGLKAAGAGVLQLVSDFADRAAETAMLTRMMRESGRPLSFSLLQADQRPDGWRHLLTWVEASAAAGLPIKAQVCGRPVGLLLGLTLTLNPFSGHPVYQEIAGLPLDEKVRTMRDPAFRARLLGQPPKSENPFLKAVLRGFDKMFLVGDPPNYEPHPDECLRTQAHAKGVSSEDLAYDWVLGQDGKAVILFPFLNYAVGNLDPSYEMLRHAHTVPGLSDGGAHVGMICDGSFPTTMLTHWARDRTRGPRLPLEWVIASQSRRTALAVGLADRGLIAPGYKADLNVIDYARLRLNAPHVVHDLPARGRRLVQTAQGYVATIVSGEIVYRDGVPTGALPGKLVRGAKAAPF